MVEPWVAGRVDETAARWAVATVGPTVGESVGAMAAP